MPRRSTSLGWFGSHVRFHDSKNGNSKGRGFVSLATLRSPEPFCTFDRLPANCPGVGGTERGQLLDHMTGAMPGAEIFFGKALLPNFPQVFVDIGPIHLYVFTRVQLVLK
jgi:hypothetical protein